MGKYGEKFMCFLIRFIIIITMHGPIGYNYCFLDQLTRTVMFLSIWLCSNWHSYTLFVFEVFLFNVQMKVGLNICSFHTLWLWVAYLRIDFTYIPFFYFRTYSSLLYYLSKVLLVPKGSADIVFVHFLIYDFDLIMAY